jgi:chemotaxis protein CheC
MILSERQKDALTEVINIAFGRAASSLSDLTKHRVVLHVPKVSIHPIGELRAFLNNYIMGDVATVHQIFKGQVTGDALLILNFDGAIELTNLLAGEMLNDERLNSSRKEALIEIGNILLNACLSTFGNILHVKIMFSMPRLNMQGLTEMLNSLMIDHEELQYALVVSTKFSLRDSEIEGYLLVVFGVSSLERLLQTVETLG